MAYITPLNRDDAGIRRLQEANAKRSAGVVTPVADTPAVDQRPAEPALAGVPRVRRERRRGDRRCGKRRQASRAVLLDTREKRERRQQERRRGTAGHDAGDTVERAAGIDIFA